MKPKNFPARRLKRKLRAQKENLHDYRDDINKARSIKTKKDRSKNR